MTTERTMGYPETWEQNGERIRSLREAVSLLDDAFAVAARLTYPAVPPEANAIRDLRIRFQAELSERTLSPRWRWDGPER